MPWEALAKFKDGEIRNANAADGDGTLVTALVEALTGTDQLAAGTCARASYSPVNYSLGGDGLTPIINNHLEGISNALGGKLSTGASFGGDVSGTYAALTVTKIRGVDVHTTAPTDGQVLKYVAANSRYEPATLSSGIPDPGTKATNDLLQYNGAAWDAKGAASGDRLGGILYTGALDISGNSTIAGNLTFPDNAYDIGASGATRPRTLYVGTKVNLNPGGGGFTGGGDIWCQTAINSSNIWFYDAVAPAPTAKRLMWSGEAAGGDLSGTLPSPTVAKVQGYSMTSGAPAKGDIWEFDGTNWIHARNRYRVLAVGTASPAQGASVNVLTYAASANEFSANSTILALVETYNATAGPVASCTINLRYGAGPVTIGTSAGAVNVHNMLSINAWERGDSNQWSQYYSDNLGGKAAGTVNLAIANWIGQATNWIVQAVMGAGGGGNCYIRAYLIEIRKE